MPGNVITVTQTCHRMSILSLRHIGNVISQAVGYALVLVFTKSADGPSCFRVLLAIELTADAIPFPKVVVCQTVVADVFIIDRHV